MPLRSLQTHCADLVLVSGTEMLPEVNLLRTYLAILEDA